MDPDSQNIKNNIKQSLQVFVGETPLPQAARDFFDAIGYDSDRTLTLDGAPKKFFAQFPHPSGKSTQSEKDFIRKVNAVHIIFQFAEDDIVKQSDLFNKGFNKGTHQSFLFVAADLAEQQYARSDYATLTREISKRFAMPVFVLFRRTDFVSLAFAGRRPSRKPGHDREVLGKVSLLRDINCHQPHAGHLSILADLTFAKRCEWIKQNYSTVNFDGLYKALLAELDTKELSKRFYRELLEWFNWAVAEAKFPPAQKAENHVIRLITRMLFVWFVKEKELIAEELFAAHQVKKLLKKFGDNHGDYYRAILQNLFFATLNTEIHKRSFSVARRKTHRNFNLYRYANLIKDKDALLAHLKKTPFINGGLFDCLDSEEGIKEGGYRIDCFTDGEQQGEDLHIPDRLFFDEQRGLLPLLGGYKFTVEESTPIEQEVALDPELLGNVFENLLANYNPETQETARRQTGSFYTPRTVVDYMVDVSLLAYLGDKVTPSDGDASRWQERLRYLLDYADPFDDAAKLFKPQEKRKIVRAIADIKVLDPAVGSGAFPMAVLHKLSLVLSRLDGQNKLWYELQKEIAMQKTDAAYDQQDDAERDARVKEISDTFTNYSKEFGRKLFLIQNSIFGVDIQSIACQIAKLRFFITLAIEQKTKPNEDNCGIKPLPNLETRFVAGNTLLGVAQSRVTRMLVSRKVEKTQAELMEIRERHFNANTRQQKLNCTKQFKQKKRTLADELKKADFGDDEADKIAAWDPFDQNAVAGWFDSEWMFGEKDGFDIVISNPPYVRQKAIAYKERLAVEYGDFYRGRADLYTYFYHCGVNLLRDNQHLCFISSNKFMRAGYGGSLRQFITEQTTPQIIIDFGELPVFDAGTDPAIVLTRKTKPAKMAKLTAAVIKESDDIPRLPQAVHNLGFSMLVKDLSADVWTLENSTTLKLLDKIRHTGTPLKELAGVRINRGVVTGCNDAFIIDGKTRERLIGEDKRSAELIKPWLDGHDIKKWRSKWDGWYVLFVRHGCPINNYPAIKNHLFQFKSRLLARSSPGADKWYALQTNISYSGAFSIPKIVFNETSKELHAFVDYDSLYINKTGFIIVSPNNEYLLGILNSQMMDYYYRCTFPAWGDPWQGGRPQFRGDRMSKLPIVWGNKKEINAVVQLVNEIQKNPLSKKVADMESEIDKIVYRLYGLTKKEIEMVKGMTR